MVDATKASLAASCLDCGKPYADFPLDVVLPRAQWLLIHPADNGVLCAGCIVGRAAAIPGATVAHLVLEVAPSDTYSPSPVPARGTLRPCP